MSCCRGWVLLWRCGLGAVGARSCVQLPSRGIGRVWRCRQQPQVLDCGVHELCTQNVVVLKGHGPGLVRTAGSARLLYGRNHRPFQGGMGRQRAGIQFSCVHAVTGNIKQWGLEHFKSQICRPRPLSSRVTRSPHARASRGPFLSAAGLLSPPGPLIRYYKPF